MTALLPGADEAALVAQLNQAAEARQPLPADVAATVAAALAGGRAASALYAGALRLGHALGEAPPIDARLDKQWMIGLDALMEDGRLDAAAWATALLARTTPGTQWLETWRLFFRSLPPPDQARPPFRDDLENPFQFVERPGAGTLIVAFCGARHRLGAPLAVLHRWFGRLDAHLLYVRDFHNAGFSRGVAGIADGPDGLARRIRALAAEHGAHRIVTFGNSMGGYAALRYGPLLDADRVLSFIPVTGGFEALPREKQEELARAGFIDIVPLYEQKSAPRARVVFGGDNGADRTAARRLLGLPTVALEAIPGWNSHDVFGALLRADRIDAVLGWMMAPDPGLDAGAVLASAADFEDPKPPSLVARVVGRARRQIRGRG